MLQWYEKSYRKCIYLARGKHRLGTGALFRIGLPLGGYRRLCFSVVDMFALNEDICLLRYRPLCTRSGFFLHLLSFSLLSSPFTLSLFTLHPDHPFLPITHLTAVALIHHQESLRVEFLNTLQSSLVQRVQIDLGSLIPHVIDLTSPAFTRVELVSSELAGFDDTLVPTMGCVDVLR